MQITFSLISLNKFKLQTAMSCTVNFVIVTSKFYLLLNKFSRKVMLDTISIIDIMFIGNFLNNSI